MSDEIRVAMSDEFPEGITEAWRCPRCGVSQGIGYPGKFVGIPVCKARWAHREDVEMEQITADAMRADWPQEARDD
jgi:hypothetical protein